MVDVLRLEVVLQVGGLCGLVGPEADPAPDDDHPIHHQPVNHAFQHGLILLFACKGFR